MRGSCVRRTLVPGHCSRVLLVLSLPRQPALNTNRLWVCGSCSNSYGREGTGAGGGGGSVVFHRGGATGEFHEHKQGNRRGLEWEGGRTMS